MFSSSKKSLTNLLDFNVWLPKEERGKLKMQGGHQPLIP